MFGGLGICSLEAVVGKDGKEQIIEVNDSATALLGESQEEDRRNIADLVLQQMEVSQSLRTCTVVRFPVKKAFSAFRETAVVV